MKYKNLSLSSRTLILRIKEPSLRSEPCFLAELRNMIPRSKKDPKIINQHFSKEEFLAEHNRLSPANLKATISLLSRFRIEKTSLFKDENWSIEKLRRPFVLWFTSLTSSDKDNIKKHSAI